MNKQKLQKLIGNNIRQARLAQDVTAQELASRCNIEKSTMSRLEAGNTNPTVYTLYKISEALDVPLEVLVKEN